MICMMNSSTTQVLQITTVDVGVMDYQELSSDQKKRYDDVTLIDSALRTNA